MQVAHYFSPDHFFGKENLHYASLQTIHRNSTLVLVQDILEGIKKEYEKEERIFIS